MPFAVEVQEAHVGQLPGKCLDQPDTACKL